MIKYKSLWRGILCGLAVVLFLLWLFPLPPTTVKKTPFGYDSSPGKPITSPPADFCLYFICDEYFWREHGFIVVCQDGVTDRAEGACVRHRGEANVLYSH